MLTVLLGAWIVFGPDPDELVEMMSAEDGRVSGQVVKVVHDDGDEQVEHQEGAEKDEGDEVGVGKGRSASLERVNDLAGGLVELEGPRIANASGLAGQHDAGPGLPGGASATVLRLVIN